MKNRTDNTFQYFSRVTALTAGVLLCLSSMYAQSNWKLRLEKNEIKVYARQQAGSPYNALKITFEVESTLSQYVTTILNVEEYKLWNYAATNSYVVERIDDSELIYYTEAKAPWPVQDRFMVAHLKVTQDTKSKVVKIDLKNRPESMPHKKGFVRMKDYHSCVTLTPLSSSRLNVECIVSLDPGGSIPAWVANMVMDQTPVKTFSNLKERLRSLGNQRGPLAFISDK